MNLSKQEEKELLQVYNTWWDSYLNGDVKTYNAYLDDNFRFVGSTGGEEFLNRKDTTAFFEATADQLAGKAKLENIDRSMETFEGMVLFTDLADAYILDGKDWVYYARFRFTSLMRETKNGWRFFYQHFSTPDLKADEGETLGHDKISKENLELRNAIKRRTAELELKNRDLEIEAALERIRARVTAMKQSSELLDIVVTMRTEFVKLGHEAHYFWHMRWLPDRYQKAMTSGDGTRIGMVMELPRDFHSHYEGMDEWENNQEPFIVLALETEIAVDYVDKMIKQGNFQQVDPSAPSLDDVRHIGGLTFISARTTHGEIGYSLPGVVKNPPKQDLDLLVRFAGTFDLAHKRFEDLKKSEQQARETKIELGLERVRGRAMAMQDSSELQELIHTVHKEFRRLNLPITGGVFVAINNELIKEINCWGSGGTTEYVERIHLPFLNSRIYTEFISKVNKGPGFFTEMFSNQLKKKFFKYLFRQDPYLKTSAAHQKELMNRPGGYARSCSVSRNTSIFMINHHGQKFSKDDNEILIRFGKVFEQTYTRFQDLQKAERQAREVQIELGLERVRSRAMAMQNSSELSDLVDTFFKELAELDFALQACIINLIDADNLCNTVWMKSSDIGNIPDSYFMKFEDYPFHDAMMEAYLKRKVKYIYTIEGTEKKEYDKYLFTDTEFSKISLEIQDSFKSMEKYVSSFSFSNFGGLQTVGEEPLSEENLDILSRFGKVFDLTYTRFNDLKLAEGQARESRIELALERVRARTMAMQESHELGDVATVMFKELNQLVENLWTCGFVLCEKDRNEDEWWLSTEEGFIPPLLLPNIGDDTHHNIYQAWKNGATYHTEQLEGDALQEHYDWLMTIPKAKEFFDDMLASGLEMPTWQKLHCAYFSYGYLVMITRVPCPEEAIFKRFAQVFDQTYTRFLDLQKAEAQARESQINLAVERIRARALAMYNSSELLAVVTLLRDEMLGLKISGVAAATIYLEEDDGKIRMTDLTSIEELDGGFNKTLDIKFNLNETDPNLFLRKVWECSDDFFLVWQRKDDLPITLKWLQEYDAPYAEEVDNFFRNIEWEYVVHPVVQLNNGRMTVDILDQEPPQELESIMKKMASAFDLTYKRFLDLQKSEEQAREAEIELALERVRARTMAMQHSDELLEVASVMFQQVNLLGVSQWNCGFNIWEKGDKEFTYYPGSPDGKIIPFSCKIPLNEHPVFRRFEASKKRGEELFFYEKKGKEQKEHYDYMLSLSGVGDFLRSMMDANFELPSYQIDHVANFAYGNLLFITYEPVPEMHDVFIRFAKVFEQTYTRFLDLQKAEIQTRETQIELSLERVRARTTAMHKSDELREVIQVIHDQLIDLNFEIDAAGFTLDYHQNNDWNTWIANKSGSLPSLMFIPYIDHPQFNYYKYAKEKGLDFLANTLSFEDKNSIFTYMFEFMGDYPQEEKDELLSRPGLAISQIFLKNISLWIYNLDKIPYSDEDNNTLMRFAKVFEQTYIRFNDLKQAEAQAREAKIEAALEKVRARAMAMHKADELGDTALLLFSQVTELGFHIRSCGFLIMDEERRVMEDWSANLNQHGKATIVTGTLDYDQHPIITDVVATWHKGDPYIIKEIHGEDLQKYYEAVTNKESTPNSIKNKVLANLTSEYTNSFYFKYGMMYLLTPEPISDKDIIILKRFAGVFKLTYRRFLDIQNAETQAREAEIELGLERVRAKTMAMQKSEELGETAELLFQQVRELGIETWTTGFNIWQNDNNSFLDWVSLEYGFIEPYQVDCEVHPFFADLAAAKKNGEDFHVFELEGAYLEEIYEIMAGMARINFEKIKESGMTLPSRQVNHYVFGEEVSLMFITFEPCPEAWDIFKRFGKVFEQTYTRFLDLQKAEEQARESEVELALERVRSRSMAMHGSDELKEVIQVIFDQMAQLNIHAEHAGIVVDYEPKKDFHFWVADTQNIPSRITVPYLDLVWDKQFAEAKEKGEDFFTTQLDFEEKNSFYKKLLPHIKGLTKKAKDFYFTCPGLAASTVIQQDIGLYIENFSGIAFTDEENSILMRIGKVFQQAYTRFLDLQKVEAQAREAEIEAALERIRSKSMSMGSSKDIGDTVAILFDELVKIGHSKTARTGIGIFDDSKYIKLWSAITNQDEEAVLRTGQFDMSLSPSNRKVKNAWKRGDKDFYFEMKGPELKKYYKTINESADYDLEIDLKNLPQKEYWYQCYFKQGLFYAIDKGEISEEAKIIFNRFAQVFEQTYARFLDLQKAEALAREAQIEVALERTRNQSMQMRHSDEIQDLSKIFHEQLHVLNIPSEFSYVWLPEEEKEEHMFWATWSETTNGSTTTMSKSVVYPLDKSEPYTAACYNAWASEEQVHETKILPEETADFFSEWKELLKGAKKLKARHFPKGIYIADAYMKYGCFGINIRRALQNDEADILHRFAIEFERAYTRFLDLKRAEAQTREVQIEAALERVRSKTMAMHNSRDVKETVKTFFDEVLKLGIDKSIRCGIGILEGHEGMETWSANANDEGDVEMRVGMLNMSIHPMLIGLKKAWGKGEKDYSYNYSEKDVLKYYQALNNEPEYPFNADLNKLHKKEFHKSFFFSSGIIFTFAENPLTEESSVVLHRFAEVFGQTYRRYLDLRKAEAQSREAQIELALERVRNRAMTMMKSDELGDLIITVFRELQGLDMELTRCLLWIFNKDDKSASAWMTNSEDPDHADNYDVLYHDHPAYKNYLKGWEEQLPEWEYHLKGKNKDKWDEILVEGFFKRLPRKVKNAMKAPKRVILSGSFNKFGLIQTAGLEPLSDKNKGILKRFSQVFEQNYNRFLDLKKAEKQAREAQIEAALEKVRARTMAMQSSHELQDAANLLFLEVQGLGINAWSAGYNIVNEYKTQSVCWMSSEGELQDPFPLYFTKEASFKAMGRFLKSEETFFVQELKGKALVKHYDYMRSLPELKETFEHLVEAGLSLPTYQINHLCKFSKGFLLFITYENSPEAHDIFKRFTKVFDQTYTRFLDLQKAESQSKESQIELALERVRASSMAMHQSEQLPETAEVLFEQFDLLGVIPDRISIAVYNESKRGFELWATDQAGNLVDHGHHFSIDEPTCMAKTYKAWKQGEQTYVVDLQGKELKDWVQYVKEDTKMDIDTSQFKGRRVQHSAFFSHGYILLSSHLPISDDMMQLLVRFAKVFQQSYTRFLDLQNAEKQAREAIKRASVDRVRAEIASMRTATDLNRITPLVWNELTTLDVPFIRCGVFIMDEEQQKVQTHLSTPDGKALASFQLSFDDTEPLDQLLPHWRKKEMYTDHWDKKAFIESTKIIMEKGAITSKETYLTKNQPENLYLHFLPFLQGMLYVGSEVPLTEDELSLVQNLAEAFSSAYARYEDFNKLELANKKIEKTLVDLKQAQSQLIQSEKMASLGELTAGIAHEIQNPLNFVNNFSEVSQELMEEMYEEIKKGDVEEALEIGNDIEQNLEKIHHHGQRASEIVKGMLQHSRSSSGVRELIDMNALTDEYLRLAYHGLRAKDKTFNAKMQTEFDEKLEKIEVIPQDIGRVILNLITNAFYAVDQKKKLLNGDYEPQVTVSTKKIKGGLKIKVIDNGNGIPKKVLEKIFQPFFTTKPTGQGTGLGLSLSYDIITAHGGELTVETKEGVGTTFIIQLSTL